MEVCLEGSNNKPLLGGSRGLRLLSESGYRSRSINLLGVGEVVFISGMVDCSGVLAV